MSSPNGEADAVNDTDHTSATRSIDRPVCPAGDLGTRLCSATAGAAISDALARERMHWTPGGPRASLQSTAGRSARGATWDLPWNPGGHMCAQTNIEMYIDTDMETDTDTHTLTDKGTWEHL